MTFHHLSTDHRSDIEDAKPLVVDAILAPVMPWIVEAARTMPHDARPDPLSLEPFPLHLLVGLIGGIKSLGVVVTPLQTSAVASTLGLVQASKSRYSAALLRYNAALSRTLFSALLEKSNVLEIADIRALGRLCW